MDSFLKNNYLENIEFIVFQCFLSRTIVFKLKCIEIFTKKIYIELAYHLLKVVKLATVVEVDQKAPFSIAI